ncbi:hypothetical protein AB4175_22775, partial [Vibrio cyclitrophicus]
FFHAFGFKQHPDKTFIGRIAKGFDWMGFWFTNLGCQDAAPRALQNHVIKTQRLYKQIRTRPAKEQAELMLSYMTRWARWARWKNTTLSSCLATAPLP